MPRLQFMLFSRGAVGLRKAVAFVILFSMASIANAQMVTDSEMGKLNVIKLLANLGRFITWPDSSFANASAPLRYCIMGRDDVGTLLDDALGGASAGDRKFQVVRFPLEQLDQVTSCHLVYIGVQGAGETTAVVEKIGNSAVVTVAQVEGFVDGGGMVQFIGSDRNVTLRLNKERLDATPLVVSSKLYSASQH